jgi:hypothetical protein
MILFTLCGKSQQTKVYLALEVASGGEVFKRLSAEKRFSESVVGQLCMF